MDSFQKHNIIIPTLLIACIFLWTMYILELLPIHLPVIGNALQLIHLWYMMKQYKEIGLDIHVIGNSDYTREEIERGKTAYWFGNASDKFFIETIEHWEGKGYKVEFKTNLFRMLLGVGKYKVVATKKKKN